MHSICCTDRRIAWRQYCNITEVYRKKGICNRTNGNGNGSAFFLAEKSLTTVFPDKKKTDLSGGSLL